MTAGLVPSINNVNNVGPLVIDRVAARCTRLRKNLGVSAKFLSQTPTRAWMVTLTYRSGCPWEANHVRDCLQRLRVWLKRTHKAQLRYIWVMETKVRKTGDEAGQVREHFHLVLWLPVSVDKSDLMLDVRGYWPHGMTNVEEAKAAVRYVMKYASKFDNEGSFPKGARCYGVGGLDDVGRDVRRFVNWPQMLQARAAITESWRPARGGGWVHRGTGELLASEYGLAFRTARHSVVVRIRDNGRPIAGVVGPFSWAPGVSAPPGNTLH